MIIPNDDGAEEKQAKIVVKKLRGKQILQKTPSKKGGKVSFTNK